MKLLPSVLLFAFVIQCVRGETYEGMKYSLDRAPYVCLVRITSIENPPPVPDSLSHPFINFRVEENWRGKAFEKLRLKNLGFPFGGTPTVGTEWILVSQVNSHQVTPHPIVGWTLDGKAAWSGWIPLLVTRSSTGVTISQLGSRQDAQRLLADYPFKADSH
jgi:hypothetical protein